MKDYISICQSNHLTKEELDHILEYEDENYILNQDFYG